MLQRSHELDSGIVSKRAHERGLRNDICVSREDHLGNT